jgi:hypothetical protein
MAKRRRAVDRHHHDPGVPAEEGTRPTRLGQTLGMVVLAGLLGLTSWVIASVSTWLVPVYVTAMALIFVTPRAKPPQGSGFLGDKGKPDLDKQKGSEASGLSSPDADPRDATVKTASDPAEALASETDWSGSGAVKPKRARSRARKPPAKPEVESATAAAAVTWIRVGPGKFVRADSDSQGQDGLPSPEPGRMAEPGLSSDIPSRAETPAPPGDPGPGSPATDLLPEAEATREEPDPLEPTAASEINPVNPGDSPDPQPVAEEYGIAPSAFGSDLLEEASGEDGEQSAASLLVCPESGAANLVEAETESKAQTNPEPRRPRISGSLWVRVGVKSRSRWKLTTGGYSGSGVSRLVRNVRSGPHRRGLTQPGSVLNSRLRSLAWKNLGRFAQVHRGFHARSPPGRL